MGILKLKKNEIKKFTGTTKRKISKKYGNYICVPIAIPKIEQYLDYLKSILGNKVFKIFIKNKLKRDQGKFHITIVDPFEFLTLKESEIKKIIGKQMSVDLIGLGGASANKDTAYFIVVESKQVQNLRKTIGLDEKDLHITLGFKATDIFDVKKDTTTLIDHTSMENT